MDDCSWFEVRRALAAGSTPADVVELVLRTNDEVDDAAIWIGGIDPVALRLEAQRVAALSTDLALYGLPFAVKDNIDVGGVPTTSMLSLTANGRP